MSLHYAITNRWFLPSYKLKLRPNFMTLDQLQEFLENYDGDNVFSLDARIENQIILNE